ncbi:MAG TPA: MFS transporter [Burkholderiales bacterium]|nr:MFS transporter [Burkholderiales bacterium]
MNLYVVVLLTILLHLAYAGGRITLPLLALNLGAGAATVGVMMSLLAALPMLFSVRAGRAVDRIGARRPMILGAAAMVAALLLACAMPRLEVLFFVSALAGSGFYLFHIAVNHAAAVIGQPEARARNFSLLALGFSTSNFLGPTVAGFAIDGIGHRLTFLLFASSAMIVLAAALGSKADTRRQPETQDGDERRVTDLLRLPVLRRVFIVSGILSMAWDLFSFVTPIYGTQIGLSASAIGGILGAFGAAIFVVRLILPLVVHRLSEWQMMIGAMFATSVLLAIFPLLHEPALLMALAFLLGVGLGGTQPMIMALLYSQAPPGRGGEAVGVRTLLLNVSQASIPLLFGALGTAVGLGPVFWLMALALGGGGWYSRRRERRD